MSFTKSAQVFSSAINEVEIGTGEKKIVLGGENVFPLYSFDAAIKNAPKVGVKISDLGTQNEPDCIKAYYSDCATVVDMAKKAVAMEGADFLCLSFEGADPNGNNKSVEECAELAKQVSDAVDMPLVIMGSKNTTKDAELFNKVSEALQGKNILVLSAKEENYKTVGASAGLAYNQKVGAESSVDINLAKQLNVLFSQLGVSDKTIVMNVGTAAAGYGFEYVASTMDRITAAALAQNDTTLQMPIITPVADEAWGVKEAIASEEDMPAWGPAEERGIDMEVVTATACLASGSNAVILKHPVSVATVSKLIKELM
jgi:acetyl-CoA decarbonylase/synthase complex subunit delta